MSFENDTINESKYQLGRTNINNITLLILNNNNMPNENEEFVAEEIDEVDEEVESVDLPKQEDDNIDMPSDKEKDESADDVSEDEEVVQFKHVSISLFTKKSLSRGFLVCLFLSK